MKRLLASIVTLTLILALFTGCGKENIADEPKDLSQPVKIATLMGPTGMGMVKLMDETDKYKIETFQAPTDAVPKLISGEVDVAALPSNMASVLYNKTGGNVVAISPMVMGVLHILSNGDEAESLKNLKGKTIIAAGKGGTPEYVLEIILKHNGLEIDKDVKVNWLNTHQDVMTKLMTTKGSFALVPEPFVSTALVKSEGKIKDNFVVNDLWKEATSKELPMGVLVANKKFVDERGDDLKIFISDISESIDFVKSNPEEASKLIVEKGFLGNEKIAQMAIPNCNLTFFSQEAGNLMDGVELLKTFNETMYETNPKAVGGKLPGDELYYQG